MAQPLTETVHGERLAVHRREDRHVLALSSGERRQQVAMQRVSAAADRFSVASRNLVPGVICDHAMRTTSDRR